MSGIAGQGCEVRIPAGQRKPLQEIERSIITKYRQKLWSKFVKAIQEYQLVMEGDRIAVAVSGGKDSMLMAKLFQELHRHSRVKFELEFITMDPGYHPQIRQLLIDNCRYLEIPIQIFESQIFQIVDKIAQDYPCYMCAKMRRGALYAKAQEMGCNKLALGHHYNDVIETVMLNIFYAGSFKTMLPKLKSQNFQGMELIRPLYYLEEDDIENFTMSNGIWPLNCACMVAAQKTGSKRYAVKKLIDDLKKDFKEADKSIFRATKNVHLESILGWRKGKKSYSYLDYYEDE
jgi:tRNA(Ile)-lysidine synthase TilS/MesJ